MVLLEVRMGDLLGRGCTGPAVIATGVLHALEWQMRPSCSALHSAACRPGGAVPGAKQQPARRSSMLMKQLFAPATAPSHRWSLIVGSSSLVV